MKKILGSLLLLSLSLFAKSAYEWKVDIKQSDLYLHQATVLQMECTFEKEGKNDDVKFVPPRDLPFEFILLSESTHFEAGKKIILYKYILFAQKEGEFSLVLKPTMLFTTQSAIDNVIVGRDNVNDLEVEKEIAKISPIKLSVHGTGSELTGDMTLNMRIDEKEVSAYSPVHLEVAIEGEGNLHELQELSFEIDGVEVFSDKPEASLVLSENGYTGRWVQRFAFVGKEDFVIPSVRLDYFALDTKETKQLKGETFPVTIKTDGINREELIDRVDLPSEKIDFKAYLGYVYYLLSFIAGFIVAKLFKLPQRTIKKERCEKIKNTKDAKALLEALMVCEKEIFTAEIDELEKLVYQDEDASLSKIKKSALKKL